MFGAILGDVFPAGGRDGAEVRHSKAGWTSASSNQRKAENRARANLEAAAGEASQEMASGAYSRMYTAGPQEARGEFDRLIPKRLRASVAGHLSASLDSPSLEHDLRRELARLRLAEAS